MNQNAARDLESAERLLEAITDALRWTIAAVAAKLPQEDAMGLAKCLTTMLRSIEERDELRSRRDRANPQ